MGLRLTAPRSRVTRSDRASRAPQVSLFFSPTVYKQSFTSSRFSNLLPQSCTALLSNNFYPPVFALMFFSSLLILSTFVLMNFSLLIASDHSGLVLVSDHKDLFCGLSRHRDSVGPAFSVSPRSCCGRMALSLLLRQFVISLVISFLIHRYKGVFSYEGMFILIISNDQILLPLTSLLIGFVSFVVTDTLGWTCEKTVLLMQGLY